MYAFLIPWHAQELLKALISTCSSFSRLLGLYLVPSVFPFPRLLQPVPVPFLSASPWGTALALGTLSWAKQRVDFALVLEGEMPDGVRTYVLRIRSISLPLALAICIKDAGCSLHSHCLSVGWRWWVGNLE